MVRFWISTASFLCWYSSRMLRKSAMAPAIFPSRSWREPTLREMGRGRPDEVFARMMWGTVPPAPLDDHAAGEPRELFGRLVPVHDRAPGIHDIQAVLDLVEKIGERDL